LKSRLIIYPFLFRFFFMLTFFLKTFLERIFPTTRRLETDGRLAYFPFLFE
jgi:hypothetical protein